MANRNRFLCLDCRTDTGRINEYYVVDTELWLSVVGSLQGMLCIACLERRLGRELNASDFTDAYINHLDWGRKSDKLLLRLTS